MFDYILVFSAPPPPPTHKINNNILIYLLLTGYCNWRPPPSPCHQDSIVTSEEEGGRIGGRQNPAKNNGAPLSVIKIVKYCGVVGGGGIGGAKILQT